MLITAFCLTNPLMYGNIYNRDTDSLIPSPLAPMKKFSAAILAFLALSILSGCSPKTLSQSVKSGTGHRLSASDENQRRDAYMMYNVNSVNALAMP